MVGLRRTVLLAPLLTLLLCLVLAPSALAGAQATKWIPAGGDTSLREGLLTSQWSSTPLRSGRYTSAGRSHRTLVRFPQAVVDDVRDKNVLSAGLWLYDTKSGACDRRVEARRLTQGFGSSTIWANQPSATPTVEGSTTKGAGAAGCDAAAWIRIPISKATIDGWADGVVANHGLQVRATNESDGLARRDYASLESSADPQLHITYNTPPQIPALRSPAAAASGDCDPTLSASFSDAEGGEGRLAFHVLDGAGNLVVGAWADSVNGEAKWQVPRNADGSCKLNPGQSYTWRAIAHDGRDYSPAWSELRGYSVPGAPATWRASHEVGDFSEWTWWGDGDPGYTGLAVVDPSNEGIPAFRGRAARFQLTADDIAAGRIHSKVYGDFHEGGGDRTNWSTSNVSGTYQASYYVPDNYSVTDDAGDNKWVNIFQFKDQYWETTPGGAETSDPTWWIELGRASDYGVSASRVDAPVAIVKHWQDWEMHPEKGYHPGTPVEVPRGRWFEIRAEVRQGDRIDFYVDGKLLNTGFASDYPVGNFHSGSFNWIFGVGHYSTNPGYLYSDESSYTRSP